MPQGDGFGGGKNVLRPSKDPFLIQNPKQQLVLTETGVLPGSAYTPDLPLRPEPGTVGTRCAVRANHFPVALFCVDLHHYHVAITPEVKSKSVNRAVLDRLIMMYHKTHLGEIHPFYDGCKSLYTNGPLPFLSNEFIIELGNKPGKSGSSRMEQKFHVAIKFASRPDLYRTREFILGKQKDALQDAIQALNVILRDAPSRKCVVVGKSFFCPNRGVRKSIGDGLEYWMGYYQSIRATQMGLSLNIDVSAASFYEPINVIDFVSSFLHLKDLSRPLSDKNRVEIKRALKGVMVEVTHRKGSVHQKISGITALPTSQLTFFIDDKGASETVVQYFKKKYRVALRFTHFPCLEAGSDSSPSYLPMEVCRIVEGQRYSKNLNENHVTGLLRAACRRPRETEAIINMTMKEKTLHEYEDEQKVGIRVTDELITIKSARVLPPPMLKYHDSSLEVKVQPHDGQWNMKNSKMFTGAKLENWACLNFSRLHTDEVTRFCNELVAMCNSKGMVVKEFPVAEVCSAEPTHIRSAIKAIRREAIAKTRGSSMQLLIIILPDSTGSFYGEIKRTCETELAIVSQCCKPENAKKLRKPFLENLALKINVKVGGRNTVLDAAVERNIPFLSDLPTIVFGADVSHPSPGDDSSPSIAAVVASMDWPLVSNYRCVISAQQPRQELINDLATVVKDPRRGRRGLICKGMIRELIITHNRVSGYKPCRIIFYRDGVSEGQFPQVLRHEVNAIRQACESLEEGYLPPITYIVVQKRHHTRLFPSDSNTTDKSGNILPGTVVDSMICHPNQFDFYLCSHAGVKGTSKPTHYHVLCDENMFTSDALQVLTNNLCYTYARCTHSVSVVAPVYYAHLCAKRGRSYIEGEEGFDDGSSSVLGGENTKEKSSVVRTLPEVSEGVKRFMYFC